MGEAAADLARLEPWLGEWTTLGVHPMLPGLEVHGRAVYEWGPGNAFVTVRAWNDHPDFPDSIAHIGPTSEDIDAPDGSLVMHWFDSRGVHRIYAVELAGAGAGAGAGDGDGFVLSRSAPEFNQRMHFALAADGSTAEVTGEMRRPGEDWGGDLCMTFARVD